MAEEEGDPVALIKFAQRLAGNEKKWRDYALKKLRKWLEVRSASKKGGLSVEDMLKIWKGLHYCMWMSDKPLIQEELADRLSKLVHCFEKLDQALLFIDAFLKTEAREWPGIDRLRLDKFMMLIRRTLNQTFVLVKRSNWSDEVTKQATYIWSKGYINGKTSDTPDGLRYHMADIYLDELEKVGLTELDEEKLMNFLDPYCKMLGHTTNKALLKYIIRNVFEVVINWQLEKARETDSEEDSDDSESDKTEEKPSPKLQVDLTALAERLFAVASGKSCVERNRKEIYSLVAKCKDIVSGIYHDEEESFGFDTDSDAEIDRATKELIAFENKIMGNKKKGKKRSAEVPVGKDLPKKKKPRINQEEETIKEKKDKKSPKTKVKGKGKKEREENGGSPASQSQTKVIVHANIDSPKKKKKKSKEVLPDGQNEASEGSPATQSKMNVSVDTISGSPKKNKSKGLLSDGQNEAGEGSPISQSKTIVSVDTNGRIPKKKKSKGLLPDDQNEAGEGSPVSQSQREVSVDTNSDSSKKMKNKSKGLLSDGQMFSNENHISKNGQMEGKHSSNLSTMVAWMENNSTQDTVPGKKDKRRTSLQGQSIIDSKKSDKKRRKSLPASHFENEFSSPSKHKNRETQEAESDKMNTGVTQGQQKDNGSHENDNDTTPSKKKSKKNKPAIDKQGSPKGDTLLGKNNGEKILTSPKAKKSVKGSPKESDDSLSARKKKKKEKALDTSADGSEDIEIWIPNKKYKGHSSPTSVTNDCVEMNSVDPKFASLQKGHKVPPAFVRKAMEKVNTPKKKSKQNWIEGLPQTPDTDGKKRRVSFVLSKNKAQEFEDSLTLSPALPFDPKTIPEMGILKGSPMASPALATPKHSSGKKKRRSTAADFF